jgi:hypothetical protein
VPHIRGYEVRATWARRLGSSRLRWRASRDFC